MPEVSEEEAFEYELLFYGQPITRFRSVSESRTVNRLARMVYLYIKNLKGRLLVTVKRDGRVCFNDFFECPLSHAEVQKRISFERMYASAVIPFYDGKGRRSVKRLVLPLPSDAILARQIVFGHILFYINKMRREEKALCKGASCVLRNSGGEIAMRIIGT